MKLSTGPAHRTGALAVLIFSLMIAGGMAVLPHTFAASESEQIRLLQDELRSLKGIVAQAGEIEKKKRELIRSKSKMGYLLTGGTTGIAGAELQRFLIDRVLKHGGKPTLVQVQPPDEEGHLFCISAQLTASINTKGLRNLLHDLETGLPLLFVMELSIQPEQNDVQIAEDQILMVRMLVEGYVPGDVSS